MAPSRIVFPKEKPLHQLLGIAEPKRLISTNGNGHGETKALTINPASFWLDGNPDYYGTVETPGLVREIRGFNAYAISALAYACMRFRSQKLIEAPLWVAEETEDGDEWVEDHELAGVLEQPNPDMEMADLLEVLSLYMDVTGRALLVKTRDRGGRVAALYPFSGDDFSVEQTSERIYGKFWVSTSRGRKEYAPEDVVFFKGTDPRNPLDGLGPLDAALAHVNIGDQMRRAVQALLRNQAKPGAVFIFPQGLTDDAMAERVKMELRANFAGAQNRGKPMVVEGTDKPPTFLEADLNNLAFGPVQDDVEAAVCSVFEIHPVLIHAKLGLTANSGLADTIKPALELFYDRFFFPTSRKIEKTLTRSLLREVDDNPLRFIRFDTSKIAALQEDRGDKITEAKNAQGFWSLNEQRVHSGQEPLEDERGDEIRVQQSISVNSEPPTKSISAKSRTAPRGNYRETKRDARVRLWRKFDVKASREESKYEREALLQFEHEKAEVTSRLRGSTDSTIQATLRKIETAYTLKDGEYYLQWLKRYEDLISQTFNAAGEDLAAEIGFDFNLANPRVQSAIKKRVNKLTGNVTDTTYQKIRDVVAEGRRNGEGISVIADKIRDDVFGGEITKSRAQTIARTETVGALNEGEYIAALESGVIASKEWLSQGDARVRDGHDIDGEKVGLDERFSNGLLYPGDQSGSADNVINCRCTLLHSDEEV